MTNAEAIGRVLYTKYVYYFQLSGLVLLIAMIGAIVLTLRHREGVKRQSNRRAGGARTTAERSRSRRSNGRGEGAASWKSDYPTI